MFSSKATLENWCALSARCSQVGHFSVQDSWPARTPLKKDGEYEFATHRSASHDVTRARATGYVDNESRISCVARRRYRRVTVGAGVQDPSSSRGSAGNRRIRSHNGHDWRLWRRGAVKLLTYGWL